MLRNGNINWTAWAAPDAQAELAKARLSPRGRPPQGRLSAAKAAYFATVKTPELVAAALL